MKLKIHWTFVTECVQNSDQFKDRLLPSAIAVTAELRFSYLHINRAPKAIDVFAGGIFVFNFFLPRIEKSKTLSFDETIVSDKWPCDVNRKASGIFRSGQQ